MKKMKMRKAYQRSFNKQMRELNKNIERDYLWQGRFIFLQRKAFFYEFEDKSGGELYVYVRALDKKTGFYKDFRIEYAPWSKVTYWHLWHMANNFIANDSCVWELEEINYSNAESFIGVPVNIKELMSKKENFYRNYKGEMSKVE